MPRRSKNDLKSIDIGDLLPNSVFAPIDLHFTRFIMQLAGSTGKDLALAAALVSRMSREGHTCVDLNCLSASMPAEDDQTPVLDLPDPEAWQDALRSEPVVGSPGQYRPLILDHAGRLYLHRAHEQERQLAEALLALNRRILKFDPEELHDSLAEYFHDAEPAQKAAGLIAATRSLCVITGGPGTGKTTLVSSILAMLLTREPHLKIALAAPTGKAAQRIAESIKVGIDHLECSGKIREKIPRVASTIHRLLAMSPGTMRPGHNGGNPISADVVVIDEASMADLALMSNLVQALKDDARLILLGDRNQLASVAAGYVLGDICGPGETRRNLSGIFEMATSAAGSKISLGSLPAMNDSIVELTRAYRFSADSPIYALSAAVNAGDSGKCIDIMQSGQSNELISRNLPRPEALKEELGPVMIAGYERFLKARDPMERLRVFESFRILCPVREGPYGIRAINRLALSILTEAGLLEPEGVHFDGMPVLITRNDYALNLFNGDIGVIVREGHELRACFRAKDGKVRMIAPTRLPEHETAFAMTVHKSQGSEFDHVLLLLPDRDSTVLTRELIYTGITRARDAIEIWSDQKVFDSAVARRTFRSSGLRSLLWGT